MKVKNIVIGVLSGGVLLLSQSCGQSCQKLGQSGGAKDTNMTLTSDIDKVSYGIGQQLGQNFKMQGLTDINLTVLVAAVSDAFAGKENRVSEEDLQASMMKVQEEIQKKLTEQGEKNKADGAKFLADNGTKEGVVTTASGLQYKILAEGQGESPKAESTVKVHYTGTLIDGTEFDSSVKRGEPVEFPVNGVIAGWTEALQLMKPGAKWELVIPGDLAYGSRARPNIPANSVLKFTVELLEVVAEKAK